MLRHFLVASCFGNIPSVQIIIIKISTRIGLTLMIFTISEFHVNSFRGGLNKHSKYEMYTGLPWVHACSLWTSVTYNTIIFNITSIALLYSKIYTKGMFCFPSKHLWFIQSGNFLFGLLLEGHTALSNQFKQDLLSGLSNMFKEAFKTDTAKRSELTNKIHEILSQLDVNMKAVFDHYVSQGQTVSLVYNRRYRYTVSSHKNHIQRVLHLTLLKQFVDSFFASYDCPNTANITRKHKILL